MIHIEAHHYEKVAKFLNSEFGDRDFVDIQTDIEFDEFSSRGRFNLILYWDHGKDGAGMPISELKKLVPIWWEFRTVDANGDWVNNDFSWTELDTYI